MTERHYETSGVILRAQPPVIPAVQPPVILVVQLPVIPAVQLPVILRAQPEESFTISIDYFQDSNV